MNCRFTFGRLLLFLFLVQCASQSVSRCALAQEAGGVLYGRWTASSGPSQVFRGTWSAEISRQSPNEAQGSWTLVNDSGEVALEGTWSARKTGFRWKGTWRARTSKGQLLSGSWDTQLPESKNQTFADLLKRTAEEEVAGFWQSGRYQGNWWLTGLENKKKTR